MMIRNIMRHLTAVLMYGAAVAEVRAAAVGADAGELRRMAVHSLRYQESNPFLCIRNLTKPLDIN